MAMLPIHTKSAAENKEKNTHDINVKAPPVNLLASGSSGLQVTVATKLLILLQGVQRVCVYIM